MAGRTAYFAMSDEATARGSSETPTAPGPLTTVTVHGARATTCEETLPR